MRLRLLVVQHEERVPLGRLGPLLRTADVELVRLRPDLGDRLPEAADGLAGLLVLGGTAAAWDDEAWPWLPATRQLLAAAVLDRTPVLGICLGAQLLASATGGRVDRGDGGPELGVTELQWSSGAPGDEFTGPLLTALGPRPLVPQSHGDAVTELPPDAELLARSTTYPHQVFRVGTAAWGVQHHPEADEPTYRGWMADHAADLAATGRTPDGVLAAFRAAAPALAASAASHAASFLALVRRGAAPA